MRDAFGGVFMIRIMLVFIVVLMAFTTVSFKYAKSFRVKNKVIDYVEQNQIKDLDLFFSIPGNSERLSNVLAAAKYNLECYNGNGGLTNEEEEITGYCYNGVVIRKNEAKSEKNTIVYNVYTYVNWDLGTVNMLLGLAGQDMNREVIGGTWEITGEAVVKY